MEWHAVAVHVPMVIWPAGCIVLAVSLHQRANILLPYAWFLLGFSALWSIVTALTGQAEFMQLDKAQQVLMHQHQTLGNLIPWLNTPLVLLRIHFKLIGKTAPEWIWLIPCIAVTVLLWTTGLLGTLAIYQLGILL